MVRRVFLRKNTASLYRLPLLFRKKARVRRLFACKRAHNAFGSLPPFCECAPAAQMRINRSHPLFRGEPFGSPCFFCAKTRLHFIGCRSFFAKRHVCVGYSLASALITPLAHYHLFARNVSAAYGQLFRPREPKSTNFDRSLSIFLISYRRRVILRFRVLCSMNEQSKYTNRYKENMALL